MNILNKADSHDLYHDLQYYVDTQTTYSVQSSIYDNIHQALMPLLAGTHSMICDAIHTNWSRTTGDTWVANIIRNNQ